MIQLMDSPTFVEVYGTRMSYVGFFKSQSEWFPFCTISRPEEAKELDTLLVAFSYPLLAEMVEAYAQQIPHVEQTFVQYMTREEVANLLLGYNLKQVAVMLPEGGSEGCGCGCGCSHG